MTELEDLWSKRDNALDKAHRETMLAFDLNPKIIKAEHEEIMRLGELAVEKGIEPQVIDEFKFDGYGHFKDSDAAYQRLFVVLTNKGIRAVITYDKQDLEEQLTGLPDRDTFARIILKQVAAGKTEDFNHNSLRGVPHYSAIEGALERYRTTREKVQTIVGE